MGVREQYEAQKAAYGRRTKEAVPQPWWWLGQSDPIARFTKWLVIWTALLFIGTMVSAGILLRTDQTLRETLTVTQRPWISVDIVPDGPLEIDLKNGIFLTTTFILKNSGHSPAVRVWVNQEFYAKTKFRDNEIEEQVKACDSARPPSDNIGYIVFPDQTFQPSVLLIADKENVSEAISNWLLHRKPEQTVPVISLQIVGCVSYQFAFGDREIHKTGFIANVSKKDRFLGISLDNEEIPAADLVINRSQTIIGNTAD